MKLISWNVNGLRAVLKKNFLEFLDTEKPDILCLQETKCTPDQVEQLWPQTYTTYWNCAQKKGYSGTAIFTMAIARGVIHGWLDAEIYTPVVLNAWKALETEIDPDGTVHGICVGTMCSEDVEYYVNRPFYDNDTHGLFAVIFAGIVLITELF